MARRKTYRLTVAHPNGDVTELLAGSVAFGRPPNGIQDGIVIVEQETVHIVSLGVQGPPGPPAPSGNGVIANVVCADAVPGPGWPLCIGIDGLARLARADAGSLACVAGLSYAAAADAGTVWIVDGPFEMGDWSAVTSAADLLPGRFYFLSSAGGLTDQVPAHAVAVVGLAVSRRILNVRIQPPIIRY